MQKEDFQDIDAVIYDLDGTLYDFKGLPKKLVLGSLWNALRIGAERKARRKLKGQDFGSEEAFDEAFGKSLVEFHRFGLKSSAKKAGDWYRRFYLQHMVKVLGKHFAARKGVAELFLNLKAAGKKQAVLSDYPMVPERLKALGVEKPAVDLMAASSDFGALKPAARPFLEVAAKLGVNPSRCLVVGDRDDTDGEGARQAGMKFVQIKTHKNFADAGVVAWEDFAKIIRQ